MTHAQGRSVDAAEVERFSRMAADWWNPNGKFAPLHRFNPVRLAFIRDQALIRFGRDQAARRPFEGLKLPSPEFSDMRALSGEQVRRIMGAVVQQARTPFLLRRDMAMIGVLTFCGIRRNELLSLEARDVDLPAGFITVRSETSKSRRLRRIPISIHLRMHLAEYMAERKRRGCRTQYLFVSHGADRGLSHHGLRHWVHRIERASGVRFHLHRFRHTFATNLAMQDVGAVKIQKLMGHSDLKMTQTYLRSVATEEMRDDVDKLSFENLA